MYAESSSSPAGTPVTSKRPSPSLRPTPLQSGAEAESRDVAVSSGQLLSIELIGNRDSARNQGLTALDLPERGINRDGRMDAVRAGVVSASSDTLAEFRVSGERRRLNEQAITSAPAVLALDAFYAGGNQASQHQERLTEVLSVTGAFTRIAVGEAVPGWNRYEAARHLDSSFSASEATRVTDPLLLYFTSGTTAKPKLVVHTQQSYPVGHLSTLYWIGLQPGDRHWNISSPGWAKHAWSSFFAPWNAEATIFMFNYTRFSAPAF